LGERKYHRSAVVYSGFVGRYSRDVARAAGSTTQAQGDRAMQNDEAVLTANRAFYHAFRTRDFAAMDALWARTAPVACIHPGWAALIGRDAVMASWRDILGQPTAIACQAERVLLFGDSACVLCHEVVDGGDPDAGLLIASNLFVREAGDWRMVHHQAGGVAPGMLVEAAPGSRLH
jgi:ketosteroid isomerase-like protein